LTSCPGLPAGAVKAPLLAYTHFVEALSVLNDCDAHHSETVRAATQKDRDLFSIK
jgi:condensin-2 complex subunit D3